jgi:hypothetical protein
VGREKIVEGWVEGPIAEGADLRGINTLMTDFFDDPAFVRDLFDFVVELELRFAREQVRADLVRRVWLVMDAAAEDSELRALLFNLARGEPNCVDAAAYSFSEMEVTVMLNKAMKEAGVTQPSVATLLKLGRGLFRLEQLDSISDVFSRRKNIADQLAVRLVYRSGLAKVLELPGQPESITYREVGGVTQEDLTDAVTQVSSREITGNLARFMARQGFWLEYLKRQFAAEFSRVSQVYDTRLKALDVASTTYLSQALNVQSDHAQAREQLVERLTRTALKDADKPLTVACPL